MRYEAYWEGAPVYPGSDSSSDADEAIDLLQDVLAILRAQYWIYQTSHWQTLGVPYYGNHLLFQRLYEGLVEDVDALAEKMVAFYGVEAVDMLVLMERAQEWVSEWREATECHMERGLLAEEDLQDTLKIAYDRIKELDLMSLGLDDWLMATASKHETNTYLLQQTLLSLQKVMEGYEQTREASMTSLEKSWGGYSSFTPVRKAEEDEEANPEEDSAFAGWTTVANGQQYRSTDS